MSPGLLEALCIQIPEQTGQELISVAPECADRRGLGDAFRQSLVWRTHAAFSKATRRALNELCSTEYDLHDSLDVLLTVATIPGHPLNAWFLDQRLRKDAMPDRDSWWSVNLHQAYGAKGAVDRLVDWAYSLDWSTAIDDEAVDLCAVALSWMLTTSNRFLRDRATAALVNLLTDRVAAVVRLVQRFADVDDPYVAERVYAVAYGVAMRCHDPVAVGNLATCVYEGVFAVGSPPPHILLRDYARGVVERALHLGSKIDVVPDHVRPPYESTWPSIPTEEDIKTLRPDWSKGSHDSGDLEWARSRIGSSVLHDDFARYVIGTNSPASNWLSLRLDEPTWQPLPRPEDLLSALVGEFSSDELAAWKKLEAAYAETVAQGPEKAGRSEAAALEAKRERASVALEKVLSAEHAKQFREILSAQRQDYKSRRPPRFDLAEIQRYVLWRVFDLGWTIDRFGHFDRFVIRFNGREASKAERIGKKYQWIAYHEIMALISDHYQYRERFREEEGDQAYEGPWQRHFRDIDPSCTLRSVPGGIPWDGHAVSWWVPAQYDTWGESDAPRDWVLNHDDFPRVEELLIVTNPEDGVRWLNGEGFFLWKQGPPPDRESIDVESRELWCRCTGYLIQAGDAEAFLCWAKETDFSDNEMPEPPRTYGMFLGEHTWAPASHYFQQSYYGDDGWEQPGGGCPVKLRPVTREYLREARGFDCSIDEGYTLHLPDVDLASGLGIRWSGRGADFTDGTDRVVAQDPTVHSEGPSALLLREDLLGEFLAREELTICWAVVGEKRVLSPGFGTGRRYPRFRMTGAYVLSDRQVRGFHNVTIDDPNG